MSDLLYYRGNQYQPGHLPKGADPAEVMPLDEFFAAARTGSPAAVPVVDNGEPTEPTEPTEPPADDAAGITRKAGRRR